MAKTLEKETVRAIELAILTAQKEGRNPDIHAIAGVYNCTYQSVCYIRRRLQKHRETGVDDRKKPGRKPLADQNRMAESIRNLLAKRPELDQSAISDYLFEEFGVRVCQATVSRILKKNGIPHKISNKLYKKSRLFRTNGDTKAKMAEDPARDVAASAPSELPITGPGNAYKSPYPPTEAVPGMMFMGHGSTNETALDDEHAAADMDMDFQVQGPATKMVNYLSPYC